MMWVVARISTARHSTRSFDLNWRACWDEFLFLLLMIFYTAIARIKLARRFDVALLLCGCWCTLVVDRESERAFVFFTTFEIGILKVFPLMKEIAPPRRLIITGLWIHCRALPLSTHSALVMNGILNLRAFDSIPQVSMCSPYLLFWANRHPENAQLWHNSTHVCLDTKYMQSAWLSCIVMKSTTAAEEAQGRGERILSVYLLTCIYHGSIRRWISPPLVLLAGLDLRILWISTDSS